MYTKRSLAQLKVEGEWAHNMRVTQWLAEWSAANAEQRRGSALRGAFHLQWKHAQYRRYAFRLKVGADRGWVGERSVRIIIF